MPGYLATCAYGIKTLTGLINTTGKYLKSMLFSHKATPFYDVASAKIQIKGDQAYLTVTANLKVAVTVLSVAYS
ncbi:hypothetical protein GCM10023313_03630 [Mucilaginibacter defluvii]|uniref:Uncharacterized protein n=1 Tax=Mucilaginibacter defluvii TaxID=1196019 RepID=A0ABP9FIL6_9SPHI